MDAEDNFYRLDIVYAVSAIQRVCVNSPHGFRGGYTAVGKKDVFQVLVEAVHVHGD